MLFPNLIQEIIMRVIRSHEQWRTIIEEQQASGLTIVEYCQQNELSTTSFYAVRKKLGLSSTNFVKVRVTQQCEMICEPERISITVGKAKVSLPATTSASYLANLLNEFA